MGSGFDTVFCLAGFFFLLSYHRFLLPSSSRLCFSTRRPSGRAIVLCTSRCFLSSVLVLYMPWLVWRREFTTIAARRLSSNFANSRFRRRQETQNNMPLFCFTGIRTPDLPHNATFPWENVPGYSSLVSHLVGNLNANSNTADTITASC